MPLADPFDEEIDAHFAGRGWPYADSVRMAGRVANEPDDDHYWKSTNRRNHGTQYSRLNAPPTGEVTFAAPPKEPSMSTLLARNVAIKGQHFLPPDERQTVNAIAADNDTPLLITLVHEPENEHDPLAVRAEIGGRKLGYLQAEVSPVVVWLMKEGCNVQFIATSKNKTGNFIGNLVMP